MITVNAEEIKLGHFPDGTQCLMEVPTFGDNPYGSSITFHWEYETDEELVTLQFLSMHYRDMYPASPQFLGMSYIPNARMDRVKAENQVFTLKYFARIINSLNFARVFVLDPHSDVSTALIDRVCIESTEDFLKKALSVFDYVFDKEKTVLYFPDAGSHKRYTSLAVLDGYATCYGEKKRDFSTGKILGLEVKSDQTIDLKGKHVLMIDDIISYGGTMYYSALKLKELGAEKISAYATHVENSVLDTEKGTFIKVLNDGTVDKLYTTPSIYRGNHEKIEVIGHYYEHESTRNF